MDVLADLLARGQARGSIFAHTPVSRACGIEFGGRRLLAVHTVVEGTVWFERDGATSVQLTAGDVILVPAGSPYRVLSTPGGRVAPHEPGSHLVPASADTDARLLCGAYTMDGLLSGLLLTALPPLVPIHSPTAEARLRMVIALLVQELTVPQPGGQTVMDRSLDLLLALSLRSWFASAGAGVPGWYAAVDDPVAGPGIAAIHADFAHHWTVGTLADTAGVSRAAFAKRFTHVVGQSPMSYLAQWRMSIAAQMLSNAPQATIAAVAQHVGYLNEYAFATAFRRHFGEPPGRWRAAASATTGPSA